MNILNEKNPFFSRLKPLSKLPATMPPLFMPSFLQRSPRANRKLPNSLRCRALPLPR
jgi:hypothetical protein